MGQAVGTTMPSTGQYIPDGHSPHDALPRVEYVPIEHFLHTEDDVAEIAVLYVPPGHG